MRLSRTGSAVRSIGRWPRTTWHGRFNKVCHGRTVAGADDQVTFPVPRDRPTVDVGGAPGDRCHLVDEPARARLRVYGSRCGCGANDRDAVTLAARVSVRRTRGRRWLGRPSRSSLASRSHGKNSLKPVTDLLWGPSLLEFGSGTSTASYAPRGRSRRRVRGMGPMATPAHGLAPQLAGDSRRCPSHRRRDLPDRQASHQQALQSFLLEEAEVASIDNVLEAGKGDARARCTHAVLGFFTFARTSSGR